MRTLSERLHCLMPGEAIHIGHSYLVINIAGLRIALDPATEDGACAAPFSNLTATADTKLRSYRPLVNPADHIPTAEELAAVVDVVVYSHLHADHFNVAILAKMMKANPRLRVLWPAGTTQLLYAPRPQLGRAGRRGLRWLNQFGWTDNAAEGLREFYDTAPPSLALARTREVQQGDVCLARSFPRVEIHVFEVRHPRPLLYVQLPPEVVTPPVVGYEIVYDDGGVLKRILLVGECSTDPEVLQRIWSGRTQLQAAFLPADERMRPPLINELYELYVHATPQILALAERLAGDRATIHGLHHGLWLYALAHSEVEAGRRQLQPERIARHTSDDQITQRLAESCAARNFGIAPIRKLLALLETVSRYPLRTRDKVRLHPLGQPFRMGHETVRAFPGAADAFVPALPNLEVRSATLSATPLA
ncbi:MAG: hypothetical protein ACT4QE_23440 [Anaerolineales bacterium]